MIIFDLDGTLADCEHRSHFVDINYCFKKGYIPALEAFEGKVTDEQRGGVYHEKTKEKWKPNWKSFFEACDQDKPFWPVIDYCKYLIHRREDSDIRIWSGRCESIRKKTLDWLFDKGLKGFSELKMRPIGDLTPDDQLKERWLDERIKYCEDNRPYGLTFDKSHDIEMVFDSDPKSIQMWRRRGIFVFNCCQHDEEF